jgi:hypothetical protein
VNQKSKNMKRGKISLGLLFLASPLAVVISMAFFGCSSVVDTPQTVQPEQDVRNYYILVVTPGTHYNYAVTSLNAPNHPASGTLGMNMQGLSDTIGNVPLYSCLWTYQNYGTPTQWFYGLTDKQAINFGYETSPDNYSDSWVDLQSPLQDSASWTFSSWGETITATVVKFGASAQVEGITYNDVVMVQYVGDSGTTGTEWFARGTGMIFSNVQRPGAGMVENQLQSVVQK